DNHAANRSPNARADQTVGAVSIFKLPEHDKAVVERKVGTGIAGTLVVPTMKRASAIFDFDFACGRRESQGLGEKASNCLAFTLVELLVVISIIALLAGLTVGLSGVAIRKSKESRMRGELNRLVTLIENYKAKIGYYPPSTEALR